MVSKRYPTSVEVARLAGVSQSAVSRTFTPGASVSARTRDKVLAAAETLGFQPSLIPRIMLTDRSGLVALVVGGLENAFYARVVQIFAARLREAGNQIVLVPVDSDYTLDAVAARLAQYRVDAIVSALAVLSQDAAETLSASRIPVVSFNTPVTAERIGSVGSDNALGGRQAAALLHDRGVRHPAFIAGPADSPASAERLAGFRDGLRAAGLPEPRVAGSAYTYEGGAEAAMRIRADAPFDGVFCANDLCALGAIDALRRAGRSVPDEVRVIGYDDIPAAGWSGYDLTSFDQDVPALVEAALAMIARMSEPESALGERVLIPPRLIERGSTRA
ncbi:MULTISPECIES: LacI family DNA-binding transcriptional regulator [unclassified Methylobacterium]|uniref:LacI family DNA-binding transcriptional regulator n=1 Tax=unclassified Methylobacterium TaxID=2615210 RepID=UPI0011C1E61A|nr:MULTISPECIES: LacI family DNA-binding transcriptional regulator [unclassified Methylobacterium]QEE37676.1 substrate-binding domain-containing protein [Methylobacterium sp. WL1]TXN54570.1 substrate-binding domain-containing protein [Methylobacterium sp. WL2]